MVAHLGFRTTELLYEEIGNIIAEILLDWEKATILNISLL